MEPKAPYLVASWMLSRRFTLAFMSLIVELTAEALARLEAAANARGVTVEELAAETLSHVPAVDSEFASLVTTSER